MKKIGLALGSGGARGWAHIGVIEALEEAGYEIGWVAGTSMGSLVGGAYASGRLEALKRIIQHLDWKQVFYYFFEVTFPRSGLIDGTKIAGFIREQLGDVDLASLQIPFRAVATDVMTGKEVLLSSGDLIDVIRASISIPGIFTPVSRDGMTLVDGGLVNPVPVDIARAMGAPFVVAVDLNHGRLSGRVSGEGERRPATKPLPKINLRKLKMEDNKFLRELNRRIDVFDESVLTPVRDWMLREGMPNVFDVLGNSIRIMEAQISDARLKIDVPDLLVRPAVGDINVMEFHRAGEAIRAGYTAAKEAMAKAKL